MSSGAKRIKDGSQQVPDQTKSAWPRDPLRSKCLEGRAWAALSPDPLGGDLNGPFSACVLCSFAWEADPFGGSLASARVWGTGMQGWPCVSAGEKCGLKGNLL